MIYHVSLADRTFEVDVGPEGVSVDGHGVDADLARLGAGSTWSLVVDGASHRFSAHRVGKETWDVHVRGRLLRVDVADERTRVIREMTGGAAAALGPKPIKAPMPGMVVKVEVEEGDTVRAGQGVVIVEAMKMENELKADADARVLKIHVGEGDAVEKDQLLVDLAALDADEGA